ncbi:MAG: tetratricopeptide repeat protein [Planctomycetaceae bacterium]|nr:tetratricopeptide repeat protein [Planctomycetaceae bacterium]
MLISEYRKFFAVLFVSVVLGGTCWAADQASETLKIARSYYDGKQYDRAISEYKRFLTTYTNHAQKSEASYFLAESLIQKGLPNEAFIYLDDILGKQLSAIKIVPKDSFFDTNYYRTSIQPKMSSAHDDAYGRQALFRAGEIAYRNSDLENGRRFLYAFLVEFSNDPYNAWTLPYLGDIAKENYEIAVADGYNAVARLCAEEAEYYFGTTIDVYRDSLLYKSALFGLGWAKARLGKYAEAIPILRQLAYEPNSEHAENAYYEWGLLHFEQGNYDQAISTLLSFEQRYPQSVLRNDSMRVRARALAGQEKFSDALVLVKQITAPKVEDYLLQIRCLYGMKENEEASKLLASLDQNSISQSVKDEIQLFKAVDSMRKNDRNNAILILETLLRSKYNTQTKQITFAYYTPENGDTSMRGKLSEVKFLQACAILCVNYAMVGRKAESDATISAMMQLAKMDDARQAHIIDKTISSVAKAADTANNPNGGGLTTAGETIPIDPSRDGGIDFGPLPVINESDLKPVVQYDPNHGERGYGYRGNSNSYQSSSSFKLQSSGDRYGNNMSNNNGRSDGVPQTTSEFKQELKNCQDLIRKKNWREADRRLLALLQNNPPDAVGAEAAALRTKVCLELGNENEAEVMCDLILNTYRNTVQYADALWVSGEYFEQRGKLDKALERFQILARDYPNNEHAAGALFHLAWDDLENGSKKDAKRSFNKIYSTYRDSDYWSHGTWGLAYLAFENGDYEESGKYIQELLNHPPDQAVLDRVLFLKGKLAEKNEDWVVAETAYRTLTQYCKDSPLLKTANSQAAIVRSKVNQK